MHRFQLRLPDDLHARLVERSATDRLSLTAEILHLLEIALGAPVDDGPSGQEGHRRAR
jgi:predicted HicB family RNase H-like nuclease